MKPEYSEEELVNALKSYTSKSCGSYDVEFDKKIRKVAPEWFIMTSDKATDKKNALLEAARKGKPKPSYTTQQGQELVRYTSMSMDSYDSEFSRRIRKLAPQWFINSANEKKKELLELARNKKPKPHHTATLGMALDGYSRRCSKTYDNKFDKKIRKAASRWFVKPVNENKKELIRMAKNGESRPAAKGSKLGRSLCTYTNNDSGFDPIFDKQIRRLRSDWFVNTANEKKKELLELAKNRKPKPPSASQLGSALRGYARKSQKTYDLAFDKEIRKLRPDWFKS